MEKTILRACILYDFKRGLKASECLKSINEALGNDAVTRSTVHAWYKRFREGGESLEDDDRAGRPSKLSKEVLKAAMEKKPDITTRELATKLRVSHTTVERHLRAMGRVKKDDRWIWGRLLEVTMRCIRVIWRR